MKVSVFVKMETMRINKYLASSGVCSRRSADKKIQDGLVTIDGVVASLGDVVKEGQRVVCEGMEVSLATKNIVIALNKPKGVVCTAEKRERNNVIDYLNYPQRIFPVGRLDKDSTGLLLLTNDGDLMNDILKARNYHEKEYIVKVNKPITSEFIDKMSVGVYLSELNIQTRECKVWKTSQKEFHIILTQGLNRQIRRMCQELGYRVVELNRIRIMNINLDDLELGKYRELTNQEYLELKELLKKGE